MNITHTWTSWLGPFTITAEEKREPSKSVEQLEWDVDSDLTEMEVIYRKCGRGRECWQPAATPVRRQRSQRQRQSRRIENERSHHARTGGCILDQLLPHPVSTFDRRVLYLPTSYHLQLLAGGKGTNSTLLTSTTPGPSSNLHATMTGSGGLG